MFGQTAVLAEAAPSEWKNSLASASRLHQLAPYIGKLKPLIARGLVERFSAPGDVVLDCFSGSGTIPLEALILGRRVLAFDTNPYAITLTRAKLEAPSSLEAAQERLRHRLRASMSRPQSDAAVPEWVRKFFHPQTLQRALSFADECIEQDDPFLMACLLSILHHQRPGFLSYPSSHLVPYLRDRKFPRAEYPDLYTERELEPRLVAKLRRTYKNHHVILRPTVIRIDRIGIEHLALEQSVDAIITSPPYMNALDYVRDNRLRMWFLDRATANYSPELTDKPTQHDAITTSFARNALKHLRTGGYCVLVVGETVIRKRIKSHPAERILDRLLAYYPSLQVEKIIEDDIPDIRRSRRDSSATKRELILVLRKT